MVEVTPAVGLLRGCYLFRLILFCCFCCIPSVASMWSTRPILGVCMLILPFCTVVTFQVLCFFDCHYLMQAANTIFSHLCVNISIPASPLYWHLEVFAFFFEQCCLMVSQSLWTFLLPKSFIHFQPFVYSACDWVLSAVCDFDKAKLGADE